MGGNLWTAGMEGTPIYMAPEQLRGEVAGPATDIYGLGVLLYRLVTRHYPVEASSLHELSEKHRKGEQIPLRDRRADLPIEFVQVIERALRPDPAQRFHSAGAMEQALAATLGSMAREQERRKRNAWMLVAATAVVAIVGGVVIGQWFPPHPIPTPTPPVVQGVAPPEPPAPLDAKATLMRRRGEAEDVLAPGSAVEPGDRLSLLLRGTDSMYVYVLNEDTQGEVFCLYPVGGLEPGNPLTGRMEHRLPGDLGDETFYWTVTSAGGRESIVAIGSREPLPDLEAAIAEVPRARRGRPLQFAKVNPMALRNLRGISGAEPMTPPAGEARRRLEASLAALRERAEETGQIWVWSIELANPPSSP
jgi:hypothetical protein